MASVQKLVDRMRYWCLAGDLGYDQNQRWDIRVGGECDCSSLVIWALREAGFDTGGSTYTGNLSSQLTARGWARLPAGGSPQAGDILLNDVHHVAVFVGGGQLAQASIDERGRASGGQSGDQANETNVKAYYSYPWNCYLRYVGSGSAEAAAAAHALTKTDGQYVLDVDGIPGAATNSRLQQVMGTPIDGVIDTPSPAARQLQHFLNSVVSSKDIHNLGASGATDGRLDEDGILGEKSWKVFQYWAFNVRRDLCQAYAPGWGIWDFADGIDGERTWKVLQHMLNESYANSGKLLAR